MTILDKIKSIETDDADMIVRPEETPRLMSHAYRHAERVRTLSECSENLASALASAKAYLREIGTFGTFDTKKEIVKDLERLQERLHTEQQFEESFLSYYLKKLDKLGHLDLMEECMKLMDSAINGERHRWEAWLHDPVARAEHRSGPPKQWSGK